MTRWWPPARRPNPASVSRLDGVPREDRRHPGRLGHATRTTAARTRSRRPSRSRPRARTTVKYRSVDEAGNAEAAKSVAFGVGLPDPGFPVIQVFADPATGRRRCWCASRLAASIRTAARFPLQVEELDEQLGVRPRRDPEVHLAEQLPYTAKVTATDDEGESSSKDVQVVVTCRRSSSRRRWRRPPTPTVARRRCALQFNAAGQRCVQSGGRPAVHVGLR